MGQQYDQRRKLIDADDLLSTLPSPRQPDDREPYNGKPVRPLPPLPTSCPKCTAQLMPATIELYLQSVQAVRCPICGYLTDAQMLQNRREMEQVRAQGGA